jgi:hypothetical protein
VLAMSDAAYQRGVEEAFAAWKGYLHDTYPTLGKFITPPEFVTEMEKYISRKVLCHRFMDDIHEIGEMRRANEVTQRY